MDNDAKQFTCECGKRFSTRNELDQHRQNCATAQTSGQQVRGAGSSRETNQ